MHVKQLIAEIEAFQRALTDHQRLWGQSLEGPIPDYPVRHEKLMTQSRKLSRAAGRLRPYLDRLRPSGWTMGHPATGTTWDALQSATGMADIALVKGDSLRSVVPALDQIIGELRALDPDDDIPREPNRPIRSGGFMERVALAYLEHLHPFIREGCGKLLADGHHAQAIGESAKAVLEYWRRKTDLKLDGTNLAEVAFSLKRPVLAFGDLSDESARNEQLGFMELVKGVALGVRNPLAHTHGREEEFQVAFEYLVLASLLCRRIDQARRIPETKEA
jgi:uncharacterized protein (TIGR02391 family)